MTDWIALGHHRYRVQDDVICFETFGDFAAAELQVMNDLQNAVAAQYGFALFFINNRVPGMLSTEARRLAVENNRSQRAPWSMALIGFEGTRTVVARAAVLLAARGIRLLTGRRFYLEFFPTEQQARSWLATQRQDHQELLRRQEGPSGPSRSAS